MIYDGNRDVKRITPNYGWNMSDHLMHRAVEHLMLDPLTFTLFHDLCFMGLL